MQSVTLNEDYKKIMTSINENTNISLKTLIAVAAFVFQLGYMYREFNNMEARISKLEAQDSERKLTEIKLKYEGLNDEFNDLKTHYFNFIDKLTQIVYNKNEARNANKRKE